MLEKRVRKYGMNTGDFAELLKEQNFSCAICKKAFDLSKPTEIRIDHDHKSNLVRGMLCPSCNVKISFFKIRVKKHQVEVDYFRKGRVSGGKEIWRRKIVKYIKNSLQRQESKKRYATFDYKKVLQNEQVRDEKKQRGEIKMWNLPRFKPVPSLNPKFLLISNRFVSPREGRIQRYVEKYLSWLKYLEYTDPELTKIREGRKKHSYDTNVSLCNQNVLTMDFSDIRLIQDELRKRYVDLATDKELYLKTVRARRRSHLSEWLY